MHNRNISTTLYIRKPRKVSIGGIEIELWKQYIPRNGDKETSKSLGLSISKRTGTIGEGLSERAHENEHSEPMIPLSLEGVMYRVGISYGNRRNLPSATN